VTDLLRTGCGTQYVVRLGLVRLCMVRSGRGLVYFYKKAVTRTVYGFYDLFTLVEKTVGLG